ncbi:hypothetical protein FB566_3696 [Stackebrandtia endophytica]|uniref:Uncharacterized protein n=1 Tax=Stackebrandtia endophytica TaxID=1496996 RepID=A0A543AZX6_9ACTN|nr:hypothetical protein [Stackebrandtia endophytica]TQL78119.1 hypothetical protein FB566_3696 [Stackebrandtia endophytica]
MPNLGALHRKLTVTVTSPDAQIRATRQNITDTVIRFRPNAFDTYRTADLEHQFSVTLNLLWQGWRDGCRQIITAAGGEPHRDDHQHWDANRRRYRQAVDALEIIGRSPGQRVRIHAVGMRDFTVRIKPGSLPEFTEATFTTELLGAIQSLTREHQDASLELKDQHFSLNLPQRHRQGT